MVRSDRGTFIGEEEGGRRFAFGRMIGTVLLGSDWRERKRERERERTRQPRYSEYMYIYVARCKRVNIFYASSRLRRSCAVWTDKAYMCVCVSGFIFGHTDDVQQNQRRLHGFRMVVSLGCKILQSCVLLFSRFMLSRVLSRILGFSSYVV